MHQGFAPIDFESAAGKPGKDAFKSMEDRQGTYQCDIDHAPSGLQGLAFQWVSMLIFESAFSPSIGE